MPSEFLISILNFTSQKIIFGFLSSKLLPSPLLPTSVNGATICSQSKKPIAFFPHLILFLKHTSVVDAVTCTAEGTRGRMPTAAGCPDNSALCPLWKFSSPEKSYLTQGHPPFLGARSHTETDVWGRTPNTGLLWKAIPASVSPPLPPQGISWGFTETASQPSFSCPACFLPFPFLPCRGCWPQEP